MSLGRSVRGELEGQLRTSGGRTLRVDEEVQVSREQDRGSQENPSHDTDRKGSAVSFKYNKHSLPFQTIFSNRENIIKSFGQNMLIIFSTRKRGYTLQIDTYR